MMDWDCLPATVLQPSMVSRWALSSGVDPVTSPWDLPLPLLPPPSAPGPLLGGALDRSHSTGCDEPRRRNCPWLTAPGSPHIRQPLWVLPSQPFSGLPAAAGIPPGLARPLCRTGCPPPSGPRTVHLPQDAACRQGSSPLDSHPTQWAPSPAASGPSDPRSQESSSV